jgi:hypothetical protein
MADLGALRLLISDQGGTAVLGRLRAIDKAGRQTQATFQQIASANALGTVANQARAGTVAMSRQISALAALHRAGQLTNNDTRLAIQLQHQLTAAVNTGNLSLQKRATLAAQSARLSKITGIATVSPQAGQVTGIAGAVRGALPVFGALAATMAAANLASWFGDSARAADDFDRSIRKVGASAKLLGVAEGDIRKLAQTAEDGFALSTTTASDLAVEITKLAKGAGQLDQSEAALRSFLDLGAARGLDAAQTLTAVRQSILGIDEGTDKLFGVNPSSLWKDFAASIGTTAGKLSDAQKLQALLTATIRDGGKVRGEYQEWLKTAGGQSAQLAQANERLKVAFGRMFSGVRADVTSKGAALLTWLADGFDRFRALDQAGEQFWENLARHMRILAPLPIPTLPGVTVEARTQRPTITISGEETEQEKIAKVMARLEEERRAKIAAQVAALVKLVELRKLEAGDVDAIFRLEAALTAELERGNLTLQRRVDITEQLLALQGALGKAPGVRGMTPSKEEKPPFERIDVPQSSRDKLGVTFPDVLGAPGLKIPQEVLDRVARDMQIEQQLTQSIGSAIANGIINGFAVGLSQGGIAEGFAQMGAQILQQFGALMVDLGVQAIIAGKFMAGIMKWIVANPILAIALGAGLVAAGAAIGGRRSRGVGGAGAGSGGFGGTDTTHIRIADRAGSVPNRSLALPGTQGNLTTPGNPVTVNVGLLNPNDPASQRLLLSAVRSGERRGL